MDTLFVFDAVDGCRRQSLNESLEVLRRAASLTAGRGEVVPKGEVSRPGDIRRVSLAGGTPIDFVVPGRRVSAPGGERRAPRGSGLERSGLERRSGSVDSQGSSPSLSRGSSLSSSSGYHGNKDSNHGEGTQGGRRLVRQDRCDSEGSLHEMHGWRYRVKAIRDRLGTFIRRLGSPRPTPNIGARSLHLDMARRRKSSVGEGRGGCQLSGVRNRTPALRVRSLLDGMISAELPLAGTPLGEVTLRILGNKLVLLTRHRNRKSSLTPSCFVELPIFVDVSSLDFELEQDAEDILLIRGLLKGTNERRHSAVTSSQVGIPKSASQPLLRLGTCKGRKYSVASQDTVISQYHTKRDGRANSQ